MYAAYWYHRGCIGNSMPCRTVGEPKGHTGSVNAVAWAPHSSCHICTAGDDAQALIWDLIDLPRKKIEGGYAVVALSGVSRSQFPFAPCSTDPVLAYTADAEINQLRWPAAQSDWVSISYGKNLQVLRV